MGVNRSVRGPRLKLFSWPLMRLVRYVVISAPSNSRCFRRGLVAENIRSCPRPHSNASLFLGRLTHLNKCFSFRGIGSMGEGAVRYIVRGTWCCTYEESSTVPEYFINDAHSRGLCKYVRI